MNKVDVVAEQLRRRTANSLGSACVGQGSINIEQKNKVDGVAEWLSRWSPNSLGSVCVGKGSINIEQKNNVDEVVKATANQLGSAGEGIKNIEYSNNVEEVAEWLRRWTANPLGSVRVGQLSINNEQQNSEDEVSTWLRQGIKNIDNRNCVDEVTEWLRRWTANPSSSARVGSFRSYYPYGLNVIWKGESVLLAFKQKSDDSLYIPNFDKSIDNSNNIRSARISRAKRRKRVTRDMSTLKNSMLELAVKFDDNYNTGFIKSFMFGI
ncbi:uncharacterized protein TNCV_2154761 [Trichonephila clavipes]|nr:uncharacterized protein TNCV_2154761 [Trichonephila clavipes]